MIVMLDTHTDLNECSRELGGVTVEQLLTPLTRYKPQKPDQRFAIDNGAFSNFNAKYFRSLIAREAPRKSLCRFLAVPDVVCDARRTLEVFGQWAGELSDWPLALVCQNGQEHLPIPWDRIAAVFIGGDTDWKMGPHAKSCIKAGIAMGKWVHVGRVNTPSRFEYFESLGADSIDGSGLARFTHMREKIHKSATEPTFDFAAKPPAEDSP